MNPSFDPTTTEDPATTREASARALTLLEHGMAELAAMGFADAMVNATLETLPRLACWVATSWRFAAGARSIGRRRHRFMLEARQALRVARDFGVESAHLALERAIARAEAEREPHARRLFARALHLAAENREIPLFALTLYERGRIGGPLGWADAATDVRDARDAFERMGLDPEPLASYRLPLPLGTAPLPTLVERMDACMEAGRRIVAGPSVREVNTALRQAQAEIGVDGDEEAVRIGEYLQALADAASDNARALEAVERMSQSLAEQDAALRNSLAAQALTVKEIQHRVKNNLQVVLSLVNLRGGPTRLDETAARLRALAGIHEYVYAPERGAEVPLADYLGFLGSQSLTARRLSLTIEPAAADLCISLSAACEFGLLFLELCDAAADGPQVRLTPAHQGVRVDVVPCVRPTEDRWIQVLASRLPARVNFHETGASVQLAVS